MEPFDRIARMKSALRSLAASRIAVPEGDTSKPELLRVLRQIALSPASKPADRLRAVELLGKAIGMFQGEEPKAERSREDLTQVILQRLAALRPPPEEPIQ